MGVKLLLFANYYVSFLFTFCGVLRCMVRSCVVIYGDVMPCNVLFCDLVRCCVLFCPVLFCLEMYCDVWINFVNKDLRMKIDIEISGVTPLLMHRFNIDEQSKVREKNLTPREYAQQVCYENDKKKLYYPTTNIYACIIEAGKFHKDGKIKVTTARSSLIPAGVMIDGEIIFFKEPDKWEVDSRAVVIPSTGGRIVQHRPRLDKWCLDFTLTVDTKMFSTKFIRTILDDAGSKVGLGDFRPSRKGIYGRFVVTNWNEYN